MQEQIAELEKSGWQKSHGGKRIRKSWKMKNFLDGLDFFSRVGEVAESMNHHPDLHLENYRDLWIELWTHTEGGVTNRDIELARKIDGLASEARNSSPEP